MTASCECTTLRDTTNYCLWPEEYAACCCNQYWFVDFCDITAFCQHVSGCFGGKPLLEEENCSPLSIECCHYGPFLELCDPQDRCSEFVVFEESTLPRMKVEDTLGMEDQNVQVYADQNVWRYISFFLFMALVIMLLRKIKATYCTHVAIDAAKIEMEDTDEHDNEDPDEVEQHELLIDY
mmetsp:Transcript_67480/g.107166  ORF Transcript_67480/g.107166 Transcript_67480/m.107166 type:complete len:180 (-) Transcript_67480:332-871(-)